MVPRGAQDDYVYGYPSFLGVLKATAKPKELPDYGNLDDPPADAKPTDPMQASWPDESMPIPQLTVGARRATAAGAPKAGKPAAAPTAATAKGKTADQEQAEAKYNNWDTAAGSTVTADFRNNKPKDK